MESAGLQGAMASREEGAGASSIEFPSDRCEVLGNLPWHCRRGFGAMEMVGNARWLLWLPACSALALLGGLVGCGFLWYGILSSLCPAYTVLD